MHLRNEFMRVGLIDVLDVSTFFKVVCHSFSMFEKTNWWLKVAFNKCPDIGDRKSRGAGAADESLSRTQG